MIIEVIYFITRCLFIWSNNKYLHIDSWENLTSIVIGGIRFDLSAIIYTNIIFILLHAIYFKSLEEGKLAKIIKWFFLLTNGFFIALNFIDVIYFPFTFKRMQREVFTIIGDIKRLSIPYLLQYWYLLFLFIFLLLAINWIYNKTLKQKAGNDKTTLPIRLFSFVIVIGLSVLLARGGFQIQPIDPLMAVEYAPAQQTSAVLNTPFVFLHALGKKKLSEKNYFSENEVNKVFSVECTAIPATGKKPNIIIIILESFAHRFIGGLGNNGLSYTPFLDSLIDHSTVFTNAFANGHVSIDGNFTTIFSIPPLAEVEILYTKYAGNNFTGIASLLKPMGYSSAFFHGGNNGSFKLNDLASLAGFEKYYGRNEYNNDADYDGTWGIWDEPFLQYSIQKINAMQPPFISGIFTVSSHHPFNVPNQYKNIFKKGHEEYSEVVQYTDHALKSFFDTAAKQAWYNNTIFFICADHSVMSSDAILGNHVNQFRIPILIFNPSDTNKKIYNNVVQQSDILPTIVNITGTDKPFVSFGKNMLDSSTGFFLNRDGETYRLFLKDHAFISINDEPKELYNFKTDPLLKKNLIDNKKLSDSLSQILKAAVQQFNNRMNNNKMVIGN
jgi:phosphoglycerol transferase MdoB-like AlkP superfamily enzyme